MVNFRVNTDIQTKIELRDLQDPEVKKQVRVNTVIMEENFTAAIERYSCWTKRK